MSIEHLIETYGYWALFIGTFLEGETVLVLAGLAAKLGHLRLPWVMVIAVAGSALGDQLFFFIGRTHGKSFLARRLTWRPRVNKVHRLMERHCVLLLLGFRFLYGLRSIIPFVLGSSEVKTSRFVILSLLGAVIWSVAVGGGGYLFGAALEMFLRDLKQYELIALAAIAGAGMAVWLIYHLRSRREAKAAAEKGLL